MIQLALPNQGYGYCKCGCGLKTTIATRNHKGGKGHSKWIKGEPIPFLRGHGRNRSYRPTDIPLGSKYCGICKKIKSMSDFYRSRKHQTSNLQSYCKECSRNNKRKWVMANRQKTRDDMRRYSLKKRYGAEYAIYEELMQKQNGRCAICEQEETVRDRGTIRSLAIDHSHTTNKIRELLCNNCNRCLGLLQDNIEILEKAIAYLKKHQ